MARERFASPESLALGPQVLRVLYPELRSIPEPRWAEALRIARQDELEITERIGIIVSIGVATYVLQWVDDTSWTAFAHYLAQYVLALPLVGILVSPWLLRRTRRALRNQAFRLYGGESC